MCASSTRGSAPVENRTRGSGNGFRASPRGRGAPVPKRSGGSLFGSESSRVPDQKRLTFLFEMQKQLNAALRRQALLVKLEVAEVVSVQADELRLVNSEIANLLDPSTRKKIFQRRELTHGQGNLSRALAQQGKRSFTSASTASVQRTARTPPKRRNRNRTTREVKPVTCCPHEDLLDLRGPLARVFSRQRSRGYRGSPSRWLRGSTAAREIHKLHQRNLLDSRWTGRLSVFDRYSPLRWAISDCLTTDLPVRQGFDGERLYREPIDSMVLAGQARTVKRCPKAQWPRFKRGLAWPTFPTFLEYWKMLLGGKSPKEYCTGLAINELPVPVPLRRVKPGASVRAIKRFVLGIRADFAVPGKLLAYFQYRWGFLILKRNCIFPPELVRFLTVLWKADITRMFLVCPIRYNDALRRMPSSVYYRLDGWVIGPTL